MMIDGHMVHGVSLIERSACGGAMNREHLLFQDCTVRAMCFGPHPDRRFTRKGLAELYLALCNEGLEFDSVEGIGTDAGVVLSTPNVRECRIEVGRMYVTDRMDISFDVFRRRVVDVFRIADDRLKMLPMFGPQIEYSAVWPTEKEVDLRETFTPKIVQFGRQQTDELDAVVTNVGVNLTCAPRTKENERESHHFQIELEPDTADPRRLRLSVEGHFLQSVEDLNELERMMQQVYDFLREKVGCFVERLTLE